MGSKRLLIVEDSVDYQALLTKLFSRQGYVVESAGNGKLALERLTAPAPLPDVILLDLMMPVMDGHEFRARQSADPRLWHIPVILMTAHGDIEISRKMNLFGYVRKPVDMSRLLDVVKRASAQVD